MTEAEVLNLFRRIKVRWPNWQAPAPEDLDLAVEVYLEDYADIPYEKVYGAYKKLRDNTFAPTISEIMGELAPNEMLADHLRLRAGKMGFFEKNREA